MIVIDDITITLIIALIRMRVAITSPLPLSVVVHNIGG